MRHLERVGILLRDDREEYPVDEVRDLFAEREIAVHFLESGQPPPEGIDVVVAMGGDGTVLRALELMPECPVVAVNYGTLGFLTAGDRKDLKDIVTRLASDDYFISERLMLHCTYPGGEVRANNEIIIRTRHRLIFTDVYVNDARIRTIQGDGVVVGTPTGSTGFLLSTGAPIVMPSVRCIILDGVNEYNFSSRALILAPEAEIRLHIRPETRDPMIYFTVDGRELGELGPDQDVHIRRSNHTAKLIYFDSHYFFRNLSSKLSWD